MHHPELNKPNVAIFDHLVKFGKCGGAQGESDFVTNPAQIQIFHELALGSGPQFLTNTVQHQQNNAYQFREIAVNMIILFYGLYYSHGQGLA